MGRSEQRKADKEEAFSDAVRYHKREEIDRIQYIEMMNRMQIEDRVGEMPKGTSQRE